MTLLVSLDEMTLGGNASKEPIQNRKYIEKQPMPGNSLYQHTTLHPFPLREHQGKEYSACSTTRSWS